MEEATAEELYIRRIERSESWIKKAQSCRDDKDASFVFWWIGFSALYDYESVDFIEKKQYIVQETFFRMIVELDTENIIFETVILRFDNYIKSLIGNQYVFNPFWKHRNNHPNHEKWEKAFSESKREFRRASKNNDVPVILVHVFNRLYTLRNQVFHGGATHGSKRNRDSIEGGWDIMSHLIPVFLDIIKANPDIELGKPYFYADDV